MPLIENPEPAEKSELWADQLKRCVDLEAIKAASRDSNLTLGEDAALSKLAFSRLLELQSSLGTLLHFLSDPRLNNHEARNIKALLNSIAQKRGQYSMTVLGEWIQNQAYLGLLPEDDIKDLLHTSSDPFFPVQECSIPRLLFQGLESSQVFRVADLDIYTTELLLQATSSTLTSDSHDSPAAAILRSIGESQLDQIIPTIVGLLEQQLGRATVSSESSANNLVALRRIWTVLPHDIAMRCVSRLTLKLLDERDLARLNQWFSSLAAFQFQRSHSSFPAWLDIERHIANSPMEVKKACLRHYREAHLLHFIKRNWLEKYGYNPPKWSDFDRGKHKQKAQMDVMTMSGIKDTFHLEMGCQEPRIWQGKSGVLEDNLNSLLSIARMVLPLLRVLDSRNLYYELVRLLHKDFESASNPVYLSFITQEINKWLEVCPLVALKLFLLETGVSIDNCPNLPPLAVELEGYRTTELGRLLLRDAKDLGRQYSRWDDKSWKIYFITPERTRIIHKTMLSLAHSQNLTPRQAFRRIHRWINILKRNNAPVGLELAKALTQSAIIRYLEEDRWVSTVRLRFVLEHICRTEGDGVADDVDRLVYRWRGIVIQRQLLQERLQKSKELALQRLEDDRRTSEALPFTSRLHQTRPASYQPRF